MKENAYKVVFDDLCQIGMFTGKYDADHSNENFMYGIDTVMEYIASKISDDCCDEFNDKFMTNMTECERRAGMNDQKESYVDEQGNFHNVKNYTLTEIYDKGRKDGYRLAKEEQIKRHSGMSVECPKCGFFVRVEYNYCPNCGLKMKKRGMK